MRTSECTRRCVNVPKDFPFTQRIDHQQQFDLSLSADFLIDTLSIDSIRTNSISENENERDFCIAFFDMIDRRVTLVHTIERATRRLSVSLAPAPARHFY